MRQPSVKQQLLIAGGLALFMAVTRSPQVPGSDLLHTGSWAAFFAAGFYLRSGLAFPAFLGLAFALDAVALGWGGVSSYCLTPAYAMLIPGYGCLWAAGRWYVGRYRFGWGAVAPLIAAAAVGGLGCEAFASGGFYWLSGRFADPSLGEFALREARYFPAYLATLLGWLGVAAVVHASLAAIRGRAGAAGGAVS